MRPSANQLSEGVYGRFGELDENNDPHGRYIFIQGEYIWIGYYENGRESTGYYIEIWGNGVFRVAEYYDKDGKRCHKGTSYNEDGSELKYGY